MLGLTQEETGVVLVLHLVGQDALHHHRADEAPDAALGTSEVDDALAAHREDVNRAVPSQQEFSKPIFSAHPGMMCDVWREGERIGHPRCMIPPRRLASALLLLSAACGRVGFEAVADDLGPVDQGALDEGMDPVDLGQDAGVGGFASGCDFASITVILDGDAMDAAAGATMAAAVGSGCDTTPTVTMVDQAEPGLLDPTTFAPLFGDTTLAVLGGDAIVQNLMGYLMTASAPIRVDTSGGRYRVFLTSGGSALVDAAIADITASHDYGVVQVIRDAATNSTVIATHGYVFQGTLAGAYYFANHIAPNLVEESRSYFVIEWTDGNGDTTPNTGDTFTLLHNG